MKRKVVIAILSLVIACSIVFGNGSQEGSGEGKPKSIFLTIGAGHPTAGQPYVLRASDYFIPEVTKRVKEQTGIEMRWNEAYGGEISKVAEVLEATEGGMLQVGLVCLPFEPTKLFLHNMNYYVPFNTPDPVQATRVTRDVFEQYPEMISMFEEQYNQKFLGLGTVGSYQLLTTFPVNRVEDLKGRKIAAAGPNLPLLIGTGAVPVQSNLVEAYTSLQTGVYEGWIVPPGAAYGFKLYEVAKYQTNVDFGCVVVSALTVNLDTWNDLPSEVQSIMQDVALEYEIEVGKEAARYDQFALDVFKDEGVQIFNLPAAEKERWSNGLPNIPQLKADEADGLGLPGSDLMKAYISGLEADGYAFPKKWVLK